jgi:hypothetical protein
MSDSLQIAIHLPVSCKLKEGCEMLFGTQFLSHLDFENSTTKVISEGQAVLEEEPFSTHEL